MRKISFDFDRQFSFFFYGKNCVIFISFRAGAQSHKVVNFGIQAEFKIQENFNVNKKIHHE